MKIIHFTKPHLHNTFTNMSTNALPNAVQQSNYCGACNVAECGWKGSTPLNHFLQSAKGHWRNFRIVAKHWEVLKHLPPGATLHSSSVGGTSIRGMTTVILSNRISADVFKNPTHHLQIVHHTVEVLGLGACACTCSLLGTLPQHTHTDLCWHIGRQGQCSPGALIPSLPVVFGCQN